MHRLTFIRRGMTRRPVRSALLITSIAIAFFIYLVLTSFETFDTLAGPARTCADVAPLVQRLVYQALAL